MNDRDKTRLFDMLDASRKARSFAEGKTRADLDANEMLSFALARAIEIVGEAAARVSAETQAELPDIPWKTITGMRNKIIHDYINVDYDVVWDTVVHDLPQLIALLEELLNNNVSEA